MELLTDAPHVPLLFKLPKKSKTPSDELLNCIMDVASRRNFVAKIIDDIQKTNHKHRDWIPPASPDTFIDFFSRLCDVLSNVFVKTDGLDNYPREETVIVEIIIKKIQQIVPWHVDEWVTCEPDDAPVEEMRYILRYLVHLLTLIEFRRFNYKDAIRYQQINYKIRQEMKPAGVLATARSRALWVRRVW